MIELISKYIIYTLIEAILKTQYHNFLNKQTLFLFTLVLTGCNVKQKSSLQNTEGKYCHTSKTPFSYSSCGIEQETLLENSHKLSLKLFWRNNNDNTNKEAKPIYTFDQLKKQLPTEQNLLFATNAGMYSQDFAPIGYTVINGKQILSLNLKEGAGNFHLLPNGIFWWNNNGFYITESNTMNELIQSGIQPKYATQSGPMLVINGKIHPKFKKDSDSKKIRNGVGICENSVKFVTTDIPVNFYTFANLFKNELACDNALFLDGGIASALYSPEIQRQDKKNMGVMIALIENQ